MWVDCGPLMGEEWRHYLISAALIASIVLVHSSVNLGLQQFESLLGIVVSSPSPGLLILSPLMRRM